MQWITTTQILNDLKNSNDSLVWNTFRDHFYPVICSFARKLGLSSNYAEDIAQETMFVFLKAFRKNQYSREKGSLSNWVFGIARNVIRDFRRRLPKERLISNDSTVTSFWNMVADDKMLKHTWETEWRKLVLERCLLQVRNEVTPKNFKAFELYALLQQPVEDVCKELSMTRNAIYIAKNKVLTKLRDLRNKFEDLN